VSSYQKRSDCRAARLWLIRVLSWVAAAGNNGKDANGNKLYGQIHSPGNEPSVITRGAANTFGTIRMQRIVVANLQSRGQLGANGQTKWH
jgi:hypothetical protein